MSHGTSKDGDKTSENEYVSCLLYEREVSSSLLVQLEAKRVVDNK